MGIMSRENSRGGFPLPSSQFLPSNVLLLDSSISFAVSFVFFFAYILLFILSLVVSTSASEKTCIQNDPSYVEQDVTLYSLTYLLTLQLVS